ncbi:MAG: energy-coupling factor ABC transporter ATP-binding protein [Spirochaetaceae bacterium]|jgi:biotin transport system ATP-binding protein|nr:energy-coupling factor ABC transporter ATP-binding protein [Spirochaetaceae bacterium]
MAEPLFLLQNVSKVFPNGTAGLSRINLAVFPGECLLLAGSNGSGKTLLTRIMTGLVHASEGEVRFQGVLLEKALDAVRRTVGLVFQDPDSQIIGETVQEDVAFGPANLGFKKAALEARVAAALEESGLAGKEDFPPRRLSGGEKRRLAVAGILAMGCEAVVMDEPFANLDWHGVTQVLAIIRRLKARKKTLIILTHELEKVLAFADRLVILHKGLLRDDGAPKEVIDRLDPSYGVRDPRAVYADVADCTWLPAV